MVSLLQSAGARWAEWMLPMSWQVGVLAVLLWAAALLLRRAPASVRHLLWLLLFVKLLLDPSCATPWSAGTLLAELPLNITIQPAPAVDLQAPSPAAPTQPAANSAPTPLPDPHPAAQLSWAAIAFLVWAIIASALLLALAVQWIRFNRRIARNSQTPPEHLLRLFREQQANLAAPHCTLYLCSEITTPAVCGAFSPKVLLPADWTDDFNEEELACVFAHELAHVKRRDLIAAWFTTVLTCLYWFHPAVWLANLFLRREREMACDDAALLATGQEGRVYASAILRVAEQFSDPVPAGVGFVGLLEMSDNLLHRIRSAGDSTRPRRRGMAMLVALALMLALLPMSPWNTSTATIAPAQPAVAAVPDAEAVQPAQRAGAVALLPVAPRGLPDQFKDAPAQLNDLLPPRLQEAGVRLVDREKIDSTAKELALDASGLVQPETAARLGKIVGASMLLSPSLMRMDSQWILTARLINTETSEINAIQVETKDPEGLPALAQAAAAQIIQRLHAPATQPPVPVDPVAQLQTELQGKRLPRVVVAIPESHIGTWVPDPAGETAVIDVLARAGFSVLDVTTFLKKPPSSWWLNIFHGPSLEREGTDINVQQGRRNPNDILHDTRLDKIRQNADILLIGEAFSEYAGETLGFKSCRARIEVKAIDCATEQIAVAASRDATAADTAELAAGKVALTNAGNDIALDLGRKLSTYWQIKCDKTP